MALTALEQALLDTVEQMEREHRQREMDTRQTMRDLSERVTSLAEQVNALHALLRRVVQP